MQESPHAQPATASGVSSFSPITFFVPGKCCQQGSKRHLGNGVMVETNKNLKPWRQLVSLTAAETMNGREPLRVPAHVSITFVFSRPKSHFRTGKNADQLRPDAPDYMASAPDLDKLIRAIGDSLTGICLHDDRLIASVSAVKRFGGNPGAYVSVRPLGPVAFAA